MRFLIALLATVFCVQAQTLDPLLQKEGLWQTLKQGFVENQQELEFQWLSPEVAQSRKGTLFSLPLVQTLVRFEGEKPSQIDIHLYNRGDMGELTKEQFQELLRKTADALTTQTGTKPKPLGKDPTSAVRAEMVEWRSATSVYRLEYSFTKEVKTKEIPFRAEFMRLIVAPVPKQTSLGGRNAKAKFSGKDHVKTAANGDVLLEGIPMVDQGDKGYCVVASAERVLRYYGGDVDANELAQVANSSATEGTSLSAMFESLKKLSNRLRIRVRTLEELDIRKITDLVNDYNRMAKHEKAEPIKLDRHLIDISAIYGQMSPELLIKVQTKSNADTNRFLRNVQTQIDKGYPLLWSVMLGIVPEGKGAQSRGGHMRLIIGYNPKTSEILYSDSWGAGHELKRLSLANAWVITTALNSIEPL